MDKYDIVYILKPDFINEELRYSLRSIEQNFDHGDVWFVGGQPNEIVPDYRLVIKQYGNTKWEKVRDSLEKVCINKDISEDFWLFNDDFVILKKWDLGPAVYDGTLTEHIKDIENRHHRITPYTKELRQCEQELKEHGYNTLNYAVHCPILLNKEKVLKMLEEFPNCPMFRSLYGNMFNIGGIDHKDCKITGPNRVMPENVDFVSTEDQAFDYGAIGTQVKNRFKEKCKYEL